MPAGLRRIAKSSGTAPGRRHSFEGYGPGGTAILIQALTDNRNRTLQEVRNAFQRGGGTLGEEGSDAAAWWYTRVAGGDLLLAAGAGLARRRWRKA